ncbi:exonuclease mut-7 homolog [Panulirus ornatus]|uniref:exonuclease mut-7 homolog n=1 Tax=Panulirus ornatus TaxID=150431 RepID=UPI003A83580F
MSKHRNVPEFGMTTVEDYSGCFRRILSPWKDKNKDVFSKEMQECLVDSANPYKMSLVCVMLSPDLYKNKANSLPANILVELQSYLNQRGNKEKFKLCLSEELQKDAFHVAVRQKNTGLLKLMAKVFQLMIIREQLLPFLKALLNDGHFKEVCVLATLLTLQSQFSTAELIVPLFLQDRLCLADEFLDSSPTHQKEILLFIDDIIGKKISVKHLEKYKVKDVKKIRSSKILSNTVFRMLKRFGFDPSICPHFQRYRANGGLRYLFYKYYKEKSIQKSSFFSLVDDTLQEHPDLSLELLYLFTEYSDPQAAIPYVAKLQIASSDVPKAIKKAMLNFPHLLEQNENLEENDRLKQEEELWDVGVDSFYSLSLPLENVLVIETVETLERCIKDLQDSSLLGIDSEWKPTFGLGLPEQAAVMQFATTKHVFLLDLLALHQIIKGHHWYHIGQLFSDPQITKVGYGIKGDSVVLGNLHTEMRKGLSNPRNFIDLDHIKGILLEEHPNIFSHKEASYKGLSDLVYRCFGLPLNKKEQFSNWSRRPFTKSQIMYAAIDARCLIDIYTFINQRAEDLNIPDWKNIKQKVTARKERGKKKQMTVSVDHDNTSQKIMRGKEPVYAADFHVVCDTMLQGLAKQLRLCGIDAKALENGENCDRCIDYFEREKRVVLTQGGSYKRLSKFIPAEYVYNVPNEVAKQQLAEIIEAFNVKVTLNDIFARCTKCNSGSYILVPSSVFVNICSKKENSDGMSKTKDEWVNCQGGQINISNGVTSSGVTVQVEHVRHEVIEKTKLFYVCSQCGHCYWDGTHHSKILNGKLKNIVEVDRQANNVEKSHT